MLDQNLVAFAKECLENHGLQTDDFILGSKRVDARIKFFKTLFGNDRGFGDSELKELIELGVMFNDDCFRKINKNSVPNKLDIAEIQKQGYLTITMAHETVNINLFTLLCLKLIVTPPYAAALLAYADFKPCKSG